MYFFLLILLVFIIIQNLFIKQASKRSSVIFSLIVIVLGFAGLVWTAREPAIIIFSFGTIPLFSLIFFVLGLISLSKKRNYE